MLLSLRLGYFACAWCLLCGGAASAQTTSRAAVPLAGNTFFSNRGEGITLSDAGISQWTDSRTKATVYIRFLKPGEYHIGVRAKSALSSTIRVSLDGKNTDMVISHPAWTDYDAGKFNIPDSGYFAITLQGIQKAGPDFAEIASIEIDEQPGLFQFVKDDFYWGRRGPSVHLSYVLPSDKKIQWLYNEVTIPPGMDVIGSYFMANGFKEGYFGIQVNSETERRILFSVWSPFKTDDPNTIPDSAMVRLLAKGNGVYTGAFGNEGSGGQSYLRYPWKAGVTYKFLTGITPNRKGASLYTSYFHDPGTDQWILIASFLRPQTDTWYERPHSFLENFIPENGAITRTGLFGNQWACDTNGHWTELTTARFTTDATGKKKARMDFAGGVAGEQFFLKNCGFFQAYTLPNTVFERKPTGRTPSIAFDSLPKE